MKKVFVILLATIMLFSMAIPAYAALPDPPVSPQYKHINSYSVVLDINESLGVASCYATCYQLGADTVEIEYKLQRYTGSSWVTIKTWTSTGTTYASISKTWPVSSGYTYRGKAIFRVYDSSGNLLETGSTSRTYIYPSP